MNPTKLKAHILALALFALVPAASLAQEWSGTFIDADTPQSEGRQLTVAADGSWFASTLSQGHFYLTKFNPTGDLLWSEKMKPAESIYMSPQNGAHLGLAFQAGEFGIVYAMNSNTRQFVQSMNLYQAKVWDVHIGKKTTGLITGNGWLQLTNPAPVGYYSEGLGQGFDRARIVPNGSDFAVVAHNQQQTHVWYYKDNQQLWTTVLPGVNTRLVGEIKSGRMLVEANGLKLLSLTDGSLVGSFQPNWAWGKVTLVSADTIVTTHYGLIAAYSLSGQRLWVTPIPKGEDVRLAASGSRLYIASAFHVGARSTLAYMECDPATGRILRRIGLPFHASGNRSMADFIVSGNRFGILYHRFDLPLETQSVHLFHGQTGTGAHVDEALPLDRDETPEMIDQVSDRRGNVYSLYKIDSVVKFLHTSPDGSSRMIRSWRSNPSGKANFTLTEEDLWVVVNGSVERFSLDGQPGAASEANSYKFFKILVSKAGPIFVSPHGFYLQASDKFSYQLFELQDAVLGIDGSIVGVGLRDNRHALLPFKDGQLQRTSFIGEDPVEKMVRNSSGIYLLRSRIAGEGLKEYRIELYDFLGNKLGSTTFELGGSATKVFLEVDDERVYFVSSSTLSTFDPGLTRRAYMYYSFVHFEAEDVTLSGGYVWIALKRSLLRIRGNDRTVTQRQLSWNTGDGPKFLSPASGGRVTLSKWNGGLLSVQRF